MDPNQRKPAWWLLYATVPLFFVLVWPALQLHMPFWAHPGVEIGILVLTFGLIGLWLHANGKALWRENMRGEGGPHWRIIYSLPVRPGGVTQGENNSGSDELDNSNQSFSFQIDDLIRHANEHSRRDLRQDKPKRKDSHPRQDKGRSIC